VAVVSRDSRRSVVWTVRRTARLVVSMMYRIEEHVADPAERWALLKDALAKVGRPTTARKPRGGR
jgi:hypothetical protein